MRFVGISFQKFIVERHDMIVEVHVLNDKYIDIINSLDEIVTLDDGTCNQFKYHKLINSKQKYIFPVTSFIKNENVHDNYDLNTHEYFGQFINGNFNNALTISELIEMQDDGYKIGCHSHFHDIVCFLGKPRDYSKNIWKNELIQKFDHKIRDRINICSALLRPGISISPICSVFSSIV